MAILCNAWSCLGYSHSRTVIHKNGHLASVRQLTEHHQQTRQMPETKGLFLAVAFYWLCLGDSSPSLKSWKWAPKANCFNEIISILTEAPLLGRTCQIYIILIIVFFDSFAGLHLVIERIRKIRNTRTLYPSRWLPLLESHYLFHVCRPFLMYCNLFSCANIWILMR